MQEFLHVLSASQALKTFLEVMSRPDGLWRTAQTKYTPDFMTLVLHDLASFLTPSELRSHRGHHHQRASQPFSKERDTYIATRLRRQQLLRDLGILDDVFKLTSNIHEKIPPPAAASSPSTFALTAPVAVAGAAFGLPAGLRPEGSVMDNLNLETSALIDLFILAHALLTKAMVDNDANRMRLVTHTAGLLLQITAGPTCEPATATIMEMFDSSAEILEQVPPHPNPLTSAPPPLSFAVSFQLASLSLLALKCA